MSHKKRGWRKRIADAAEIGRNREYIFLRVKERIGKFGSERLRFIIALYKIPYGKDP